MIYTIKNLSHTFLKFGKKLSIGTLFLFCLNFVLVNKTKAADSDYGEVYTALVDLAPILDLTGSYRFGVSNPFQYSQGFAAELRFYLFSRGFLTADYAGYLTGVNTLSAEARADLIEGGFESAIDLPKKKWSLGAGVVLLDGVLNFFGKKVVPFDVSAGLLGGQTSYQSGEKRRHLGGQMSFRAVVYGSFGMALSAQPYIENSATYGSLAGADVLIGLFYRIH